MTVIAQEGQFSRFGSLVKYLADHEKVELHYDTLIANEAAPVTYTLGTVLGKVTATGKYIVSKQGAADGSQTPAAVVLFDSFGAVKDAAIPATTDTKVIALVRGKAIVAKEALKLDASFSTAPQKQAAYDALKALGIFAEASV
jgi:hypothetical protein